METRERVRKALHHEQADRVPIDFGAHRSSGIAVQAYQRLRDYLGLPKSQLYVYDVIQQLAIIEDDVLDMFDIDVVQLGYQYYKKPEYWKEWTMHDGTKTLIPKHTDMRLLEDGSYGIFSPTGELMTIQKPDCLYFEQVLFPYEDLGFDEEKDFGNLEQEMEEVMWVSVSTPPSPDTYKQIGQEAKELRASTHRSIYGIFGGNLMEIGQQLYRMDNFFVELGANPDRADAFLDALLELHMSRLKQFLKYVGPHIDVIGVGDDLGMQSGPMVSKEMFGEFFTERYKTMWDLIHKECPHLTICLHCCGSVYVLLPGLIAAGLDAINPVQITCQDMEPKRLKKEFGEELVFWGGGCDTRDVLPNGSKQEIEENVKRNMEIFAPNGGFVFQQVHNILADVPAENIVHMLECAKKYGSY